MIKSLVFNRSKKRLLNFLVAFTLFTSLLAINFADRCASGYDIKGISCPLGCHT